ncbi:hypothetical protein NE237_023308 [Protea cynaroides]|uniref:S1-like domain-containing protein n=1 Tax=Protea cynaroides TaxID=273540 RepID=A0A9Q0HGW6_9MAGN|nr:hypothetical protein NE237_023308 [Protea cynaroides]
MTDAKLHALMVPNVSITYEARSTRRPGLLPVIIVLVGLRDYQDDKADVILKYMPDEARLLKAYGELPENTRLNEGVARRMMVLEFLAASWKSVPPLAVGPSLRQAMFIHICTDGAWPSSSSKGGHGILLKYPDNSFLAAKCKACWGVSTMAIEAEAIRDALLLAVVCICWTWFFTQTISRLSL